MTGDAGVAPNKALRRELLLGLAALVAAIFLAVLLPARQEPPLPPLPNPNGYDDFLKARTLLAGDIENATLGHDELSLLIASNAPALGLLRFGLSRACSAHTDAALTNLSWLTIDLPSLKKLATLMALEGRLAEMENRNADAAHSYLDVIRFGNDISRGGFVITRLVGIAVEGIGRVPLVKLVPKLSCTDARSLISELIRADQSGVPWEEILRNEHRLTRYIEAHTPAFNPILHPITWATGRWQAWQSDRGALRLHKSAVAHLRLIATELALRCYQASKGQPPPRLDDLVPDYLTKVPQDPFSHRALIYQPKGAAWLLYSIGPDGVDDGGRPFVRSSQKGDMFFDSP